VNGALVFWRRLDPWGLCELGPTRKPGKRPAALWGKYPSRFRRVDGRSRPERRKGNTLKEDGFAPISYTSAARSGGEGCSLAQHRGRGNPCRHIWRRIPGRSDRIPQRPSCRVPRKGSVRAIRRSVPEFRVPRAAKLAFQPAPGFPLSAVIGEAEMHSSPRGRDFFGAPAIDRSRE